MYAIRHIETLFEALLETADPQSDLQQDSMSDEDRNGEAGDD